jgi:hypothetical protein
VGFLNGAIDANTRFADGDIRKIEGRFSPENLPHNLALVALLKPWAERKQATPGQIALAWLLAQKPWIVPIPGTTQMAHMVENTDAAGVRFTPAELAELDAAASAIQIQGLRCPRACWPFPRWKPARTTRRAPNKRGRRSRAGPFPGSPRRPGGSDDPDYQIFTRSAGATYSLSPGLMSNAAYQPGWLRMVPLTR